MRPLIPLTYTPFCEGLRVAQRKTRIPLRNVPTPAEPYAEETNLHEVDTIREYPHREYGYVFSTLYMMDNTQLIHFYNSLFYHWHCTALRKAYIKSCEKMAPIVICV